MRADLKTIGDAVIESVKGYVQKAADALNARIDAIADQVKAIPAGPRGEPGEKGLDGAPGRDGQPGERGEHGEPGPKGDAGERGMPGADGPPGRDGAPGQDGKSITIEEAAFLVRAAVAELPPPAPGKDGANGADGRDGEQGERGIQGETGPAGKSAYEIAVTFGFSGGQDDWLKSLRGETGPMGPSGRDGIDGKDINAEEVERRILAGIDKLLPAAVQKSVDAIMPDLIAKAAAAVPVPRDGAPGRDGKDADMEQVESMVVAAVAEMPRPADGKSITPDDVLPMISDLVSKSFAAIPIPKDGASVSLDDVRPVLELELGKWALDFERRAADVLQRAIDKMPAPKDGRDALDLEDLNVEHDGDGNVMLKFQRGELVKEFALRLPRFKDQKIFREGAQYREGDGVTWRGSFFLAQKDSPEGEPGKSDDWRLAVQRGRDGKDGRDGSPIEPKAIQPVRLR